MESPLKSIGFSKLDDDYTVETVLQDILRKPTEQDTIQISENIMLTEHLIEVAEDTYIMARVGLDKKSKAQKLDVYDCEPYVKASNVIKVVDVSIECIDDSKAHYVICEDEKTSMQLIFWLQNVIEYLRAEEKHKKCTHINMVALALEATIVLPVEKDEEDDAYEKEERDKMRAILQKTKEGDEEAKEVLEKEEKELDEQLKERMKKEDFLTIMSSYFIPVTLEEAMYAVLGEIRGIKERKNTMTKEEMYILTLNVNDMELEVVVNKETIVGVPSVGMRFMGTCWLQGTVTMV